MNERRRCCVACLRVLLGTARWQIVSNDPRPEARTARGSCTEIHGVFTDFSQALTLELRTRHTEGSTRRVYERCAAQMLFLRVRTIGLTPENCTIVSRGTGPAIVALWKPWKRINLWKIVLWSGCPVVVL